jgi:tetratricopeptide (TPR) repeat protein
VIPVLRIVLWVGLLTVVDSNLAQVRAAPDSRRQEALALEQQGKNAESEEAWRAYLAAHPSDPEPYAHLGLLEARQEHYKKAVPLYRKALAMNPAVPGLRLNLGLALFKDGDLKEAIHEFSVLLASEPASSPEIERLNMLIGMAHYGLAEYAEAVPYLKQAAAKDTQSLPLLLALAHSCLWSKQTQCVIDVYHQILALNAESAEADMLAGEAMDEMKDNAGAVQQFRAAVKANPKEPSVHFGLGYLLWAQKKYPEAAQEFQAELANDPKHIQSMLYLADTDVQMNQMVEAKPLLERVEKINPGIPLTHLDLGIVYTEANRKEAALRELSVAAGYEPDNVNVHWRLARLYRAMGKPEMAKAEFDKAGALNQKADDDLYKKIANANAPHGQSPAAPVKPTQP